MLMALGRQLKRGRGSTYHDPIPLDSDFSAVYAREGKLRRTGLEKYTLSTQLNRIVQQDDAQWEQATTWHVEDDPEFALDADGAWYDEVVEGNVMQDFSHPEASSKSSKSHSRVSVRDYLLHLSFFCFVLNPFRNVRTSFGRNFIVKITLTRYFDGPVAAIFVLPKPVQTVLPARWMPRDLHSTNAKNVSCPIWYALPAVSSDTECIHFII